MEEKTTRGPILTVFSILFALLAVSNFSKPLSRGRAGFVFFGTKTSGLANAVLGRLRPILGRIRNRDLATETMGGADGVGIRRLRAHQHDALYAQNSAELASAALRSNLYSDRAWSLVGFRDFVDATQGAASVFWAAAD
jgi:hypothetical protein